MAYSAAVRKAIAEWLKKNHCHDETDDDENHVIRCDLHDDEIAEVVNLKFGDTLLGDKKIGKAAAASIRKVIRAQPPHNRRVAQESRRGKFGEGKQNLFNRVTVLEKAVRYLDEHLLHIQQVLEVEQDRRSVSVGATQIGRGSAFPPLVGPPPETPLSAEGHSYRQTQALHEYRAQQMKEGESKAQ
jgi:hypothetical protein